MKVFLFGSTGMLGNYISKYFNEKDYDIVSFSRDYFDVSEVENHHLLENLLKDNGAKKGDFVINCAGTIKPRVDELGDLNAIIVNSVFPHNLAKTCKELDLSMIHITTDCVFSGERGEYVESDEHDARDVYGKTKSLGEPSYCMNIRTSIIGEEFGQHRSLVEWVKSRKNKDANGFVNHDWNGVTCLELSKLINFLIKNNITWYGTKHIHSPESVNKYELLSIINEVYDLNIDIKKVKADSVIDRTMSSEYIPFYDIQTIEKQIKEMKEFYYEK